MLMALGGAVGGCWRKALGLGGERTAAAAAVESVVELSGLRASGAAEGVAGENRSTMN